MDIILNSKTFFMICQYPKNVYATTTTTTTTTTTEFDAILYVIIEAVRKRQEQTIGNDCVIP